jgi:ribosomal protein L37E
MILDPDDVGHYMKRAGRLLRIARNLCPTSDNRCYVRFRGGFRRDLSNNRPANSRTELLADWSLQCPVMRSNNAMPTDHEHDEDWYDDQDEALEGEESAPCPECGGEVYGFLDKCPSCGYWQSAADRRALWSSEQKPRWLVITACVVLAAFLVPIVAIVLAALRGAQFQ